MLHSAANPRLSQARTWDESRAADLERVSRQMGGAGYRPQSKVKEFWMRAITEFVGLTFEPIAFDKDGQRWHVFSFESRRAA